MHAIVMLPKMINCWEEEKKIKINSFLYISIKYLYDMLARIQLRVS